MTHTLAPHLQLVGSGRDAEISHFYEVGTICVVCWVAGDSGGSRFEHFLRPAALLTGPRVEHWPDAEAASQGPLPVWQNMFQVSSFKRLGVLWSLD